MRHKDLWEVSYNDVSIHAPAWGATRLAGHRTDEIRVFQSTHPRGVRPMDGKMSEVAQSFQSTHPRGVRPKHLRANISMRTVSIHAPAWGATESPQIVAQIRCFNPRTRVGCDRFARSGGAKQVFQSTHPRGVRLSSSAIRRCLPVSIHAPAWGATCCDKGAGVFDEVSIHAPAWGAT